MRHKAGIRPGYRARPLLIALLLLGYGLWAVYDGFVHYPEDNRQYEAHQAFLEQHDVQDATDAEPSPQTWETYAEQHNLPEDPQAIEHHSQGDMWLQYSLVIVCMPLGLLALGATLRCGWLWVGSDERGLHASNGQFAAWDAIQSVDKSRWHHKGIAVVHYTDEQGNARRLTLDDWKYETEPVRQMLRQVEDELGEPHADDEPPTESANKADSPSNETADEPTGVGHTP